MKSNGENELIIEAKNGDIHAFEILVDKFRGMAVGYAYSILKDYHYAEDVAQEAFVQAYFKLNTLQSPEAFPSWLRKIVFSQCEHLYRKSRLPVLPLDDVLEVQSKEYSPSEIAERNELKKQIFASVAALPEKERTITVLFYISEYSMAEIGSFLDLPISTVKNRLFSARKKLQRELVEITGDTFNEQKNIKFKEIIENMDNRLQKILSFYNFSVSDIKKFDNRSDAFKITDDKKVSYALKIYDKSGGYDVIPGENIYHTYEQIQVEAEILHILSESILKTAAPVRNKTGEFVTDFISDGNNDESSVYATITSFIDGSTVTDNNQILTSDMAYLTGVSAAQLHLESEKQLLSLAVRRPHKRQDYLKKLLACLSYGKEKNIFTAPQFEMLSQCCDVVLDCMNQLDDDPSYNIGLVHTDIRPVNCIYAPDKVTFIDFTRSVYSYYLYDVGEMCLHGDFGGNSDVQNAILRGYHSVKPLKKGHLFMMQVFFAMFIMWVMAECVMPESMDAGYKTWLENVLKWFTDEVHPGLISGKGYINPSVFKNIDEV